MKDFKVLDILWFNSVGIVITETRYGRRAYIKEVKGSDEETDVKSIINWGAELKKERLEYILYMLKEKNT